MTFLYMSRFPEGGGPKKGHLKMHNQGIYYFRVKNVILSMG